MMLNGLLLFVFSFFLISGVHSQDKTIIRKSDIGDGWYSYYVIVDYPKKLSDAELLAETYYQFNRVLDKHKTEKGPKPKTPAVTTGLRDGKTVYFASGITGAKKAWWTEVKNMDVAAIKKVLDGCQREIKEATSEDSRHRAYAKCSEPMAIYYRLLRYKQLYPDKIGSDGLIQRPWNDPDGEPIHEVTVGQPPIKDSTYKLLGMQPIVSSDYVIKPQIQQFVQSTRDPNVKFNPIRIQDITGNDLTQAINSGARGIDRSKLTDHGPLECKLKVNKRDEMKKLMKRRARKRHAKRHNKKRAGTCPLGGGAIDFASMTQCELPDDPDGACELDL
ncbi:MAG: hypothetical protein Q9227_006735 [Pyrenula ochraceoflavens]